MKELTLENIEAEMLKIKVPWLVKFAEKFLFKIGRYVMFFGLFLFFPIGGIINQTNNPNMKFIFSQIAIYLFAFLLVGLGGLMLISHFIEDSFVKKQAKRLGLTIEEWNHYAEKFKIMSY